MKKIILILLFTLSFFDQSNAASLIDALKEAYMSNPKLNAERENLEIAQQKINEAKSLNIKVLSEEDWNKIIN